MADFYNSGVVTTLHRLGRPMTEKVLGEMELFCARRPVALVLPATYQDVTADAMGGIIERLKGVSFIGEIVVALGPATDEEFRKVRGLVSALPQGAMVVHTEGERIRNIYASMESRGVSAGPRGKGRSAWTAYGYILATGKAHSIALHDCDIVNYDMDLLLRLCYPVVNPTLDYSFCKGYYARVTDRLHGRVTRLFVSPLIRALMKLVRDNSFLEFLDSFRYPLAGEFAMTVDVARINRVPSDWGLEVGMLAEVYRNYSIKRVCQSDIAENYEHKHQPLSAENPEAGLMKMAIDIAKSLFRAIASEGIIISEGFFRSLVAAYQRKAEDAIIRYEADAAINGLYFDRHQEAMAVDAFTDCIKNAAHAMMEDPLGTPLIPNWNRVISAIPGILDKLKTAVEDDNRL